MSESVSLDRYNTLTDISYICFGCIVITVA